MASSSSTRRCVSEAVIGSQSNTRAACSKAARSRTSRTTLTSTRRNLSGEWPLVSFCWASMSACADVMRRACCCCRCTNMVLQRRARPRPRLRARNSLVYNADVATRLADLCAHSLSTSDAGGTRNQTRLERTTRARAARTTSTRMAIARAAAVMTTQRTAAGQTAMTRTHATTSAMA
jgi:hypothetical protein